MFPGIRPVTHWQGYCYSRDTVGQNVRVIMTGPNCPGHCVLGQAVPCQNIDSPSDSTSSIASTDSIESPDSAESMDSVDSMDSINSIEQGRGGRVLLLIGLIYTSYIK